MSIEGYPLWFAYLDTMGVDTTREQCFCFWGSYITRDEEFEEMFVTPWEVYTFKDNKMFQCHRNDEIFHR